MDHLDKDGFDSATQSQRLLGIRLWQEESEFVASYAESGVRSAEGFFQRSGGCAKDIITTRMPVFIVDFFEAVQIEDDQAERRAVAAGAIEFLFEGLSKNAPVYKGPPCVTKPRSFFKI